VSGLGSSCIESMATFTRAFYTVRKIAKDYFRGLYTLEEAISDIKGVMSGYDYTPTSDILEDVAYASENEAWWILFEAIG